MSSGPPATTVAVNGLTRSAVLPDVATLQEVGVANAEYPIWFGLFVPARTPGDVVDRLHRETRLALQTAKVRDKLLALGVDPMPMTLGDFEAYVRKEVALNAAFGSDGRDQARVRRCQARATRRTRHRPSRVYRSAFTVLGERLLSGGLAGPR